VVRWEQILRCHILEDLYAAQTQQAELIGEEWAG